MNNQQDPSIDKLLCTHFDGSVADDGFCDRVMQQLPARRSVPRWYVPVGLLMGLGASLWNLSSTSMMQSGWQDWMRGHFSASAIVMLLILMSTSLLAAWWVLTEEA